MLPGENPGGRRVVDHETAPPTTLRSKTGGWFRFCPGAAKIHDLREGYVRVSEDWVDLGRRAVADGQLVTMRRHLGLNRNSMAYLLQTTVGIYTSWERQHGVGLRPATAARIGRFLHLAQLQIKLLDEEDIKINLLIPLHHAITLLGVPQELMLKMYRRGDFEAVDLGILGLWLYEEDLEQIRGLL